jgi:hypothetical protein
MRVEGAQEDLARAGRIVIDADWGALIVGELQAERIAIESPELFFEIDASGSFNWDALRDRDDQAGPASSEAPARGTFRVMSDALEIGAGTVWLQDESSAGLPDLSIAVGALRLEGIAVSRDTPDTAVRWALARAEARDWHLGVTPIGHEALSFEIHADAGPADEAGSMPLDLRMTRTGGVELSLKGDIQTSPLGFDLAMDWKGLSSRSVAPLLLRGAEITNGTASGAAMLNLDLVPGPERGFKVTGRVRHDDLSLRVDDEFAIEVDIKRFEGEIDEIYFPIPTREPEAPLPIRVAWKRIDLNEAAIDLKPGRGERDPTEASAAEAEPAVAADEVESTGGGQAQPLDLRVDALALRSGRLTWHDAALGEHSEQALSDIDFDASGLHWPPTTVEAMKLVVGSLGAKPLRIEGPIRETGADIAVRGGGIKFVPWNPLIRHYSDYEITGGSLSIRSDFKLTGDTYDSPTKITLHGIRATTDGGGFQQTFGLPLSAALTLLSDPAGDIDLKIPVRGQLGAGGELKLGVSLVDALREGIMNALTTVITSPLGLAGSLLERGHDLAFLRIGEAHFEPGSDALGQAAKDELVRAAEFVAKSPDAKLTLAAVVVAADLEAPDTRAKRPNVFRALVRGGASLFAGPRDLDSKTYNLALDLSKARLKAAADLVATSGVLAPERIVHVEWDEEVADGVPRVVLRLDVSREADD